MFVVSPISDVFDNVYDKRNARPDCIKPLVRLIAWRGAGANPKGGCWSAGPSLQTPNLEKSLV
jgi:hypothetical protein